MKLALVNLDQTDVAPPLGLAYIASYLREYADFDIKTIIIDKEDPLKRIEKEKPDVVGIGAVTILFPEAKSLSKNIKSTLNIPTILGGVHISSLPSYLPKSFDVGVIGEGEQTMLELMQIFAKYGSFKADQLENVKSVVFYTNGNLVQTNRRPLIQPLDRIPMPRRDLLKMKNLYVRPQRIFPDRLSIGTTMLTSRGCPYDCSFCSTQIFWGKPVRFFSAERVVEEIKELVEKYKVDAIRFWDDLFVINIPRIKKIIELLREENLSDKVEFYCYGRANLMNENLCKLLKELNVKYLNFGLESGSDKTLKFLNKTYVTSEKNKGAVELAKSFGFRVEASFILGSPEETKEDMEKTLGLIRNKAIDIAVALPLMPLPGTKVWEYAKKDGIVSDDIDWHRLDLVKISNPPYLNKNMTKEEFDEIFQKIEQEAIKKRYYKMVKFKIKHLFYPALIRRFVSDWRKFLREFIFRIFYSSLGKFNWK